MRASRSDVRRVLTVAALALIAVALWGCAHTTPSPTSNPRNVILMIGDGMGVAQVTAGMVEGGPLNMERLPVGGFLTTYTASDFLTDSAASGTALATGHKTNDGVLGLDPSGETLKTVLEYAEDSGMATGLVTACSITHATPAAFVAHVPSRDMHAEIASQISDSDVDVLFGGGWCYFTPDSEPGGARKDSTDLIEHMRERMPVALTPEEFDSLPDDGPAAALLYREHPPRASERAVPLSELTRKAIDILSRNEHGFFLMVEGSQIDWAGHENDEEWLIEELLDFDDAVGTAMDFAEKDGNTLVVVTADHETGGYQLIDASREDHKVTWWKFGSDNHTATMVPLLAYGPGSRELGGIGDNTDLGRTLIAYVRR